MSDRRDSIKIRVENSDYEVVGGSFQQLLAAVKALPGRRFLGQEKIWSVPGSLTMVRGQLENSGFLLEGGTPAPETAAAPVTADSIAIQVGQYELSVTGGSFREMLSVIKAMPGRRFDGQSKVWHIPSPLSEVKAHLAEHQLTIARTVEHTPPPSDSPTAETTASPPPAPPLAGPPPLPPADPLGWDEEEADDFHEPFLPLDELDLSAPPPPPPPPHPLGESGSPPNAPSADKRSDKIKLQVGDLRLAVVGGTFQEMLQAVKSIPGRRFDSESKSWVVSAEINSVQQHIKAQGFVLVED
jgi:hypothetical protein